MIKKLGHYVLQQLALRRVREEIENKTFTDEEAKKHQKQYIYREQKAF